MTERFPNDNQLQCAWDGYLDARQAAERSGKISDGILAGKMWRRFIYLFADPDRIISDNNIERLPDPARRGDPYWKRQA